LKLGRQRLAQQERFRSLGGSLKRLIAGAFDGFAVDVYVVPNAVAQTVARRVVEDGEQPGPEVGARLEGIFCAERLEHRLLDQIFGIRRHPGQPEGRPIQAVN